MKLCVALDSDSKSKNLKIAKELKEFDVWLKIGFRSFIRDGKELINELKSINNNFNIFLDLKLYDIPNTMIDTANEICNLDIDMFNIHASCGFKTMKIIADNIKSKKDRPIILAVTALTSFDNDSFIPIYGKTITDKVKDLTKLTYKAGIDGVVCSAYESLMIKKITNKNFLTLTPGIKIDNTLTNNDQKRVADIQFAINNLVDFIVVGRAIYKSKEPKEVVCKILDYLVKQK